MPSAHVVPNQVHESALPSFNSPPAALSQQKHFHFHKRPLLLLLLDSSAQPSCFGCRSCPTRPRSSPPTSFETRLSFLTSCRFTATLHNSPVRQVDAMRS